MHFKRVNMKVVLVGPGHKSVYARGLSAVEAEGVRADLMEWLGCRNHGALRDFTSIIIVPEP
jgi:hypothetical protein